MISYFKFSEFSIDLSISSKLLPAPLLIFISFVKSTCLFNLLTSFNEISDSID